MKQRDRTWCNPRTLLFWAQGALSAAGLRDITPDDIATLAVRLSHWYWANLWASVTEAGRLLARGVTEVGKLIPQGELGLYGFPFSRTHLARLVQAGRLPEPVKVGYGKGARNFYDEDELLAARARADAEARRRAAERPPASPPSGKRKK